jgi:hypothetical protein
MPLDIFPKIQKKVEFACLEKPINHIESIKSVNETKPVLLPRHLRNKFTLMIGDSQDRESVIVFCDSTGGRTSFARLNGTILQRNDAGPGDSRICVVDDQSGNVFVLMSIFHFGAMLAPHNGVAFAGHLEEGFPPELSERIRLIPYLISGIAGELFPQLCARDGVVPCPSMKAIEKTELTLSEENNSSDATRKFLPPTFPTYFPIPDLVVAQSSLWDILNFNLYIGGNSQLTVSGLLSNWTSKYVENLLEPLHETLRTGISLRRKMFTSHVPGMRSFSKVDHDSVPIILRTCPLTIVKKDFGLRADIVAMMNDIVRVLADGMVVSSSTAWIRGVLDWAKVVLGADTLFGDGYHQNDGSKKVYLQMILNELYLMDS